MREVLDDVVEYTDSDGRSRRKGCVQRRRV